MQGMTIPRWVCYGCLRPVALRDNEPFRWLELTDYRKNEMQAVAAICDQFPKCEWKCETCGALGSRIAQRLGCMDPECVELAKDEMRSKGLLSRDEDGDDEA